MIKNLISRLTTLNKFQQIRFQSTNNVLTEKFNEIFIIKLNRPDKRNCVNIETAKQLLTAFESFDSDNESKVAILCGNGGNFCAGFDLAELSAMEEKVKSTQSKPELDDSDDDDSDNRSKLTIGKGPMGPTMLNLSKPTIAAIDGYCVAGGLELALLCDLRICEEQSILGVLNRRFGVPLIDGGTVRLPKIIGLGHALDLILTGRKVDAKEALSIGLVNSVVEVGTVLGRAVTLAQSIKKFPQECLKADRRSVYYSLFEAKSIQDALKFEYENGSPIIEKESINGAKKFIESGIGRHGKFNLENIDEILEKHKPKVI